MNNNANEKYGLVPEENKEFDFAPFIMDAVDRNGQIVVSNTTGKPLQYLSTDGKLLWFRKKYPSGRVSVKRESEENPRCIRYSAEIYLDRNDNFPVSRWEHQETIYDDEAIDRTVSRVQTIALGKALSKAGFGCEIEATLNLTTEGEMETEITNTNKNESLSAPSHKNENVEEESSCILSLAEALLQDSTPEKGKSDDNSELTKNEALKTVVHFSEKAADSLKKHEGLTIADIVKDVPEFCSIVKRRKRIQQSMNAEAVEAAIFLAEKKGE